MRKRYQNLHHPQQPENKPPSKREIVKTGPVKRKKSKLKAFLLSVLVLILIIVGYLGISSIQAANNVFDTDISVASLIKQSSLKQTDGITNVLLLGRDQAANLTDTIQIVRIRQSDKKVAMVSIPRDLQVKVYKNGNAKINSVFSQGFNSEKQQDKRVQAGADLISKTVEEVSGVPIHYYLVIDFTGLKDVVDSLGGITVNVEKAFYDAEYPRDYFTKDGRYIKTNDYDPFSVKAGIQNMDGTTALKYARSRHGSNGEGSDFARAARQQQIILAIKEKGMSVGVLANPAKISNLIAALGNHMKTNMAPSELSDALEVVRNVDKASIISKVISNDANDGLLVSISEGGYYLIPKAGNFSQVQAFIKNIFNQNEILPVDIEVYNGTKTVGLAGKLAESLKAKGYNVTKIENSDELYTKTTIFDGTSSSKTYSEIKAIVGKAEKSALDDKGIIRVIIGSDYGN